MKHLKIFEDFQEFKKPSFLQRAIKSGKKFFEIESKEDRESLDSIHRALSFKSGENYDKVFVKDVREVKPGVIVAYVTGKSLLVDKNTPSIMYNGKELSVNNLEFEVASLFDILKNEIV